MSVLVSPSRTIRKRGAVMRAAVLREPGCFDVIETAVPEPADNEVCIRVEGCGICGSNLPVWEGREWFSYPLEPGVPGHEAWGVIAATGDEVTDLRPGQRVTILSQHGFAEYDTVTPDLALPLPPELDGQPFPGEPLGCAVNVA